ncbi:hypothetical protein KC331_g22117, partial [Hortaea werneckii]
KPPPKKPPPKKGKRDVEGEPMSNEQPKVVRRWFSMPALHRKKSRSNVEHQDAPLAQTPAAAPPPREAETTSPPPEAPVASAPPVSQGHSQPSAKPSRLSLRERLSKWSLRPKSSQASTTATKSTQESRDAPTVQVQGPAKVNVYPESEGRHTMPTSQAQEAHAYTKSTPRSIKAGAVKLGGKLALAWTAFKIKHHL